MTSFVVKKVFKEYAKNNFGTEDPYFEYIPATRLDGTPTGKVKKVKKALPPGISEHDAKVLTKMKRRAYRLDSGLFSFFGTRLGWESVIGLVPVAGDIVGFLLALMVINTAKQIEGGLPFPLKIKMYIVALIDLVIGFVPFVGDAADAVFKANNRNTVSLEAYLRERGRKNLRESGLPIPDVDPSDPNDHRLDASARPEPYREEPMMSAGRSRDDRHRASEGRPPAGTRVSKPAQARVRDDRRDNRRDERRDERREDRREDRRGGSSEGWFGRLGSKRSRPADVEAGVVDDAPPMRESRRR